MKISTTKNVLHLSKDKIHPLNNSPIPSPKRLHFGTVNIEKVPPHLSPNKALYSRNDEDFLLQNGARRQMPIRSPHRIKQNEGRQGQQSYGLIHGSNNLKITSPKSNQLPQNHKHIIQFQNQYQNIPVLKANHPKFAHSPNTLNRSNPYNPSHSYSPSSIHPAYDPSQNLYTNRQAIYQVQSRYESQRNSNTTRNQITTNGSLEKSTESVGKTMGLMNKNLIAKGTLSKSKIISSKRISYNISNSKNQLNSADAQYFGHQLKTVTSSGAYPTAVSPRGQSKKKTNFLRLSKSLENTSLQSKIKFQPTKNSNKISFDKMYDDEDFDSKNNLKEPIHNFQFENVSIDNFQTNPNFYAPKKDSRNGFNLLNDQEDEKTRLKLPSFHKYPKENQQNIGSHETNRGFFPEQNTVNDEYMIQTRNVNQNPQVQHHLVLNRLHLKPAQISVMKNSQFVIKPSMVSESVKNKIVFNTKSPEHKNPMKVVTFNNKYDPSLAKISKSLERPQSFNNPSQNDFQRNIGITNGSVPNMIVRPHSSMSQFIPAQPHVQIRFQSYQNSVNQKADFISIDRISSLSPQEQTRRPYSQAPRPLSKLLSSSMVQNSSGNSKFGQNSSQNMNSHILQVNSTIKVESVDYHGQNVAEKEDQNYSVPQNNIIQRGNIFYHLKSKNSNAMHSIAPSHELSSIIMGMKSYKQNNSYFNEGKGQQKVQGLAYNQGRGQRKGEQMKGNSSKPSSASSKGQSRMVESTLPIDSKLNSPQTYIFGNGSQSIQNHAENIHSVPKSTIAGSYIRSKSGQHQLIGVRGQKIITHQYYHQQRSFQPELHSIQPRSIVVNAQKSHQNAYSINQNPAHSTHNKFVAKNNQAVPGANGAKDNQQNEQEWLNINRQKYSTSEYLNFDQIKGKFPSFESAQSNAQSPNQTDVYRSKENLRQIMSEYQDTGLECIRQTEKQHLKLTYQRETAFNKNLEYEQPHSEDHFYHMKRQDPLNSQMRHQPLSPQSDQHYVNSSQNHIEHQKQFTTYLPQIQGINQIAKINKIEQQENELRKKINSISETVLSMSPIHLPDYQQQHQHVHTSSNENHTDNSHENQVDRTKEHSCIQPLQKHQNSYVSDVDYEYSQDESSNQDYFHSIPSSRLSGNKDLSDTRKITHAYKATAKKSHNKMKTKKSQLNQIPHKHSAQPYTNPHPIQKLSTFSIENHLQDQNYNQFRSPNVYQAKQIDHINSGQNTGGYQKTVMTDSLKRQIQGQGKILYTPIQSSEIIQLSSLNSLSFHFIATNYQPSKNSCKQVSLLTLSKGHMESSKQLNGQQNLAKSYKISKKLITQPILQEQSLYRPIPYTKHINQTDQSLERSSQEQNHKTEWSSPQKKSPRQSLYNQRLKQSQYGIAEDSVNYIPIERMQKKEDSSVKKIYGQTKNKDKNQRSIHDQSISQVQYYQSQYEYPSEDLIKDRGNKEHGKGYFDFQSQYLNSVEGEGSFSNVIETMNLHQYHERNGELFE